MLTIERPADALEWTARLASLGNVRHKQTRLRQRRREGFLDRPLNFVIPLIPQALWCRSAGRTVNRLDRQKSVIS